MRANLYIFDIFLTREAFVSEEIFDGKFKNVLNPFSSYYEYFSTKVGKRLEKKYLVVQRNYFINKFQWDELHVSYPS